MARAVAFLYTEDSTTPVMARITTSHAVADRNRRLARELAGIGMIPEARGGRASDVITGPRPLFGLPSSQDTEQRQASGARRLRRGQEIAETTDGLDDVDVELLADAADEDLDRIRVAVEILVIEMLHQLGARHHAPGMVHQVGQFLF